MSKRIALLRGINLGKVNRVAMAELRELAAELGLEEAVTHLQSGNLIYGSSDSTTSDQRRLTGALADHFGLNIDVVVIEGARLAALTTEHPFADDPKSAHIGIASQQLPDDLAATIAEKARGWERFEVRGDILFADFGGRVRDSRVAGSIARMVQPGFITMRNLATARAIVDKAGC